MQVEIPEECLVEIHQSGVKPLLWFGCEPGALVLAGMANVLIFYMLLLSGFFRAVFISLIIWLVFFRILKFLGEKDPKFIAVYLCSLKHKRGFWTAKPSSYRGK